VGGGERVHNTSVLYSYGSASCPGTRSARRVLKRRRLVPLFLGRLVLKRRGLVPLFLAH
jgi:hypothetical protein